MNKTETSKKTQVSSRSFSPKLKNLEVSMSYEGLSLKTKQPQSLEALKRQYAR
ncbi:hypothetical protein ACRTDO_07125 [Vibrio furnissii]|uniref:hypothetical protein n=1 Tax=Vibrio furnissii TaxID=29494 RepID=UPI003D7EFDD4